MYARLISYYSSPEQTENLASFYRQTAGPSMQAEKGFEGGYLLVDSARGMVVTLSLWDSEADMRTGEGGNRSRQAKAREAGVVAEVVSEETFEVMEQVQPAVRSPGEQPPPGDGAGAEQWKAYPF